MNTLAATGLFTADEWQAILLTLKVATVATLAALGVLFLIVVTTSRKASTDVFIRKRKKNS